MIEFLYRRKLIRELLNQYSNEMWNQLVPLLAEIGIVFMKKNYNLAGMSLDDYKNILEDLKNPGSELSVSRKLKKENEEKVYEDSYVQPQLRETYDNVKKIVDGNREKPKTTLNNQTNQARQSRSNSRGIMNRPRTGQKQFVARKPSGDWRKGNDERFKENYNLNQLRRIYSSSSPDHFETAPEETENPNYDIYPSWWGGKQRNHYEGSYSQSPEKENSRSKSVSKEKYKPQQVEVFIPKETLTSKVNTRTNYKKKNSNNRTASKSGSKTKIKQQQTIVNRSTSQSRSKSRPKSQLTKQIYPPKKKQTKKSKTPPKHENDELYDNLKYVESKIRSQVVYDKYMHENLTKQKEKHQNSFTEWKYKDNVVGNYQPTTKPASNRNNKTNYMISYDKNFKPEEIREKSKDEVNSRSKQERLEKQENSFKNESKPYSYDSGRLKHESNNSNTINSANSNYNQPSNLYTRETANFNDDIRKEDEEYNRKLQQVLYRNPEANQNLNLNKLEEISFKKSDKLAQSNQSLNYDEDERLSSYAPSERTKNIFQREFLNEMTDKYRRSTGNNYENNTDINVNFSNNSQNFSGSAMGSTPY